MLGHATEPWLRVRVRQSRQQTSLSPLTKESLTVLNTSLAIRLSPAPLFSRCRVAQGHRQGDGYQLQPPDIPYEDEGVPEWPPGYDPDIALIEYMERQGQVPKGSAAAAVAEKARCATESSGEGARAVEEGGPAAGELGSDGASPVAGAGADEAGGTS